VIPGFQASLVFPGPKRVPDHPACPAGTHKTDIACSGCLGRATHVT
jgi:hypothetical protein